MGKRCNRFWWLYWLAMSASGAPAPPPSAPVMKNLARLPLAFEKQSSERFLAHGQGYAIGLKDGKATIGFVLSKDNVTLEFAGSKPSHGVPGSKLPGKANYFRGNNPQKWQIGLATYERFTYSDVYPGIDVIYYGNQQQLEFDLVVKAGVDPRAIRMRIGGGGKLSLDGSGAVKITERDGASLAIALPKIYQEIDGTKKSIAGHYAIRGGDEVVFNLEHYDRSLPLVIDPTIVYSTLLGGGTGGSVGSAIAVDFSGNILIAGSTSAADFPTVNAAQGGLNLTQPQGFVSKLNAAGTALIYSTYLGGSLTDFSSNGYNPAGGGDYFQGIAADGNGAAWVTGETNSSDFALVRPVQATYGGQGDAVVVKLDSAGALQSGSSGGAIVAKFSPSGPGIYAAVLAGYSAAAIAADTAGNAWITGRTSLSTPPVASVTGPQQVNNGGADAFVAALNPAGAAFQYFTVFGGAGSDAGTAIALDTTGNVYLAGTTNSTGLATAGTARTSAASGNDGFVAKLNLSANVFTFVTYLGDIRQGNVTGLAVDPARNIIVTGYTNSPDFPVISPLEPVLPGYQSSLFLTTNYGASWSAVDSNIPAAAVSISVNPVSGSILVFTDSGIFRSVNGGASWSLQSPLQFYRAFPFSDVARSPAAPATLYFPGLDHIYRSTDDGVTWNSVALAPPGNGEYGILADPLTPNTAYLFNPVSINPPFLLQLYKTTDGGTTWTSAATGLTGTVQAMAGTADGSLYAAAAAVSKVYKSTDQGASWSLVNNGLPAGGVNWAAPGSLSASGNTVYFANGTIYVTTNGGAAWTGTAGYIGASQIAASPVDPSVLYVLTSSGTVQASSDGGSTWNPAGTGLPQNLHQLNDADGTRIVADPTNSAKAWVTTNPNPASTGFVSKVDSTGSAFIWSTYLGSWGTRVFSVASDGAGNAYVTGSTNGQPFPPTTLALSSGMQRAAFVTKISDSTAACSFAVDPATVIAPPQHQLGIHVCRGNAERVRVVCGE